jgi:hypothetical protein
MPDDFSEFRIKASLDASDVTSGAGQAIAGIKGIADETIAATAVADKYGISVDLARKALSDIKKEDAAAELARIKDGLPATRPPFLPPLPSRLVNPPRKRRAAWEDLSERRAE